MAESGWPDARKLRRWVQGGLLVGLAGLVCLPLAAGASVASLSVSGSYFQGLPRSVAAEFLALPIQQRNMSGWSGIALESFAQAGVRNMIFCREELSIYRHWVNTGRPSSLVPGPMPVDPLAPGNSAIRQDYAGLRLALQAAGPAQLRTDLTANGSCGQWVPARPGTRRPTIAQVVDSQHA